ncbi:MAG: UDP-N-acetylmuramoyl-L-alanyl-D-glutamate--2,6-diaminopimelate ligase [Candidatus Portiera sp.]|nr:UDP-N-acetylmuramoyl-L-alanyl-D-glutamate--2,6-diaminopimelate ligase [Portiera sp.]
MNTELNNTIGSLVHSIYGITGEPPFLEIEKRKVAGITLNHSDIKNDWIFVALKGEKEHGLNYLKQVEANKPAAVLMDEDEQELLGELDISKSDSSNIAYYKNTPVIMISNLRNRLSDLGNKFYSHNNLQWIGITGTNGKSSIAHMLGQSLSHLGHKTAVVGSVYNGFPSTYKSTYKSTDKSTDKDQQEHMMDSSLTTPDILTLCRYASEFKKQGAEYVALECSSHALSQGRTDGLNLVCGVFTNLTMDHTDYHANMEEYAASKYRLFGYPELEYAVINYDDPIGVKWYDQLRSDKKCLSYGSPKADIFAEDINIGKDSTSFNVHSPQGKGMLNISTCSLWGVDNALATLGVLLHLGYKLNDSLDAISESAPLAGRMQKVPFIDRADFIIDYAHSPDALMRTLQSARHQLDEGGELWIVFGCGGNRDTDKRGTMGKIADEYADRIILTNDNPRYEDAAIIINEIMQGIKKNKSIIIQDRGAAIQHAFINAKPNDLVLVAGKGHESHQDIMGEKRQFNDYEFVAHQLNYS